MPEQKTIVCRESGTDCDWEVRDADEGEALESAREHARRRHGTAPTLEELRRLLRPASERVGGI